MSRGWLIVFAKAPRPGLVKTRMSPPLSLNEAAELYAEMLADVLAATGRYADVLDLEPVVAFHPPDAERELVHRAPPGFRLQAQRGRNLGDRMAHACREAAAAGVERLLIRGSDSPTLALPLFEEAMARLDAGDDVVLSPDQDGGYALVGLGEPAPRLFEITMSTSSVLEETLARAGSLGLRAGTTRPGLDVDTVEDLQLLRDEVQRLSVREAAELCPRTIALLDVMDSPPVL